VGSESRADIYRYLDENGVECFTDTPATQGATRVVTERRKVREAAPAGNLSHLLPNSAPQKPAATGTSEGRQEATLPLPVRGVITSPVGLRHDPIDGQLRHHNGVDIAVPEGTPVKPVAPGVVTFSGYRPGYGNMVVVSHEGGMVTIYAHNSANLAAEGEKVAIGSTIALSGSTGRSTGPHLHFEAWKYGQNLTPSFVSGMPVSEIAGAGLHRHGDGIRRILQTDGSLLFTNLR
jgi:murein DD-endopeptidase MepM/ murein hydrolase activator NlpD